jgi:phenylalanyl-tRNA synthetase alpha chain
MNLSEFKQTVETVERTGTERIAAASNQTELDEAKGQFLGRKSGKLTECMRALPSLPIEERKEAGALINEVKGRLEALLDEKLASLSRGKNQVATGDLTMPSRKRWVGGKHPVTIVIDEIQDIFRELGFTIAVGPEAETEEYNFTALNFPPDHPAMDMHDTLYLGEGALLRTHTSPVQVRTLQRYAPPIRILAPGKVFRRDPFDASHAPAFEQIEGLAVDEGISFVDLKSTLTHFAQKFFGKTRTRFRPSYFPFTEPSAEMDVECRLCGGVGCSACKGTGWMEIMGSGMVHPAVLEAAGIDSEKYTGWAFGMGPARIAMLRYGLPDIRLLYDSDVRFLEQVAE